jgi:hypothetical protein
LLEMFLVGYIVIFNPPIYDWASVVVAFSSVNFSNESLMHVYRLDQPAG